MSDTHTGASIAPSKQRRVLTLGLAIVPSVIFLQSLAYKFTGAPEPVYIFSTLDAWAADSFGISGLFNPGGVFSAAAVGAAELVASILMLAGAFAKKPRLLLFGAVLALGVISGAIFFHLFTPLGIVVGGPGTGVTSDGGTLFGLAIVTWICAAILVFWNKSSLSKNV